MSTDADRIARCHLCGLAADQPIHTGGHRTRCHAFDSGEPSAAAAHINALANEAMESIEVEDGEEYAFARCAIEHAIAKAIAQITAELDEAQENERRINRERESLCRSLDQERAAHERTKAELAEAQAEWQGADCKADAMRAERDAAQAEAAALKAGAAQTQLIRELNDKALTKAQADAAAMRECLSQIRLTVERLAVPDHPTTKAWLTGIDAALAGTAGRDLAERVTLWRELERASRNQRVCGHRDRAGYPDCDACVIDDALAKLAALDAKGGG